MVEVPFLVIAGLAIIAGTVVQSSIGLGLGLVAAPVVALVQPSLMPGAMIIPAMALPLLTVRAELAAVDWRGIAWTMPGRVVGVALGVWVVASLPPRLLAAGVGAMVLVAVVLTARTVRLRTSPATLNVAAFVSGITGTATTIGGPPIALVYQHADAARVRATLGVYFLIGTCLALGGLAIGGELPRAQVVAGLTLLPFVPIGYLIARPLRGVLRGGRVRVPLLVVIAFSGVVLLAQAIA